MKIALSTIWQDVRNHKIFHFVASIDKITIETGCSPGREDIFPERSLSLSFFGSVFPILNGNSMNTGNLINH